MLLEGRRVLVTGAASRRGIGQAACALFARHGAEVIALDRDEAGLAEGPAAVSARELVACDVTSAEGCAAVARQVGAAGGLDGLVHCAGVAAPMRLADLDRASYDRMMDVNLWGTIQLTQALVPLMTGRPDPSIVCLSSLAGQRGGGFVGGLHYAAAKAGVLGFVRGLARELGPQGIRVNAVAPGLVDTDMTLPFMAPEQRDALAKQAPLGRLASAEEVASACLFLISSLASYVTGATLDVNGGLHIH